MCSNGNRNRFSDILILTNFKLSIGILMIYNLTRNKNIFSEVNPCVVTGTQSLKIVLQS